MTKSPVTKRFCYSLQGAVKNNRPDNDDETFPCDDDYHEEDPNDPVTKEK